MSSKGHGPAVATRKLEPTAGRGVVEITAFLSAFLLFQVQLIAAKHLLPWFGGAPVVWNTCMVFFQLVLLAGHTYVHVVTAKAGRKLYSYIHLGLLLTGVMTLVVLACLWVSPIYPGTNWRPAYSGVPIRNILALLAVSVGLPFFVLSTTSPLTQVWVSGSQRKTNPYRIYALSNLGSLAGLLTYPLLVEPNLSLRNQGRLWAILFGAFALACGAAAWNSARSSVGTSEGEQSDEAVVRKASWRRRALWFGLAGCGSCMLLAVTNLMSQELTVSPLLWVAPMSIYLITYILCFLPRRIYRRGIFYPLFVTAVAWSIIEFLQPIGSRPAPLVQFTNISLVLFVACMVYHGELAALKPRPANLTAYYLSIALGGACGSIFVSMIAPFIFPALWEFQLGLWGSGLLLAVVLFRQRGGATAKKQRTGEQRSGSWLHEHPQWLPSAALVVLVAVVGYIAVSAGIARSRASHLWLEAAVVASVGIFVMVRMGWLAVVKEPRALQAITACGWCIFGVLLWYGVHKRRAESVVMTRSLYGVLHAEGFDPVTFRDSGQPNPLFQEIMLVDGITTHGAQFQDASMRRIPTTYYVTNSGIGILLRQTQQMLGTAPLRMGVVGLGSGTLSTYGKAGDYLRFYELNPDVVRMAQGRGALFSFVKDSPATIDVVQGDGRISMENELASGQHQNFDILVLDAFSSDSIPVHLLTREAMDIYAGQLRGSQSVVAFHISNKSVDLGPVVMGLAKQRSFYAVRVTFLDEFGFLSDWVLMSADGRSLLRRITGTDPSDSDLLREDGATLDVSARRWIYASSETQLRYWTDDYSNVFQVLK